MLATALWASHVLCPVTLLCIKAGCKRLHLNSSVRYANCDCTYPQHRLIKYTTTLASNAIECLFAYNLHLPQDQYMVKHVFTGPRDQFSVQPGAVQLAVQSA